MALGHDRPGRAQRATSATAATVKITAPTARLVTERQFCFRSRGDASKAASSSTGATNRVSASWGSRLTVGRLGSNASTAPASANNAG